MPHRTNFLGCTHIFYFRFLYKKYWSNKGQDNQCTITNTFVRNSSVCLARMHHLLTTVNICCHKQRKFYCSQSKDQKHNKNRNKCNPFAVFAFFLLFLPSPNQKSNHYGATTTNFFCHERNFFTYLWKMHLSYPIHYYLR